MHNRSKPRLHHVTCSHIDYRAMHIENDENALKHHQLDIIFVWYNKTLERWWHQILAGNMKKRFPHQKGLCGYTSVRLMLNRRAYRRITAYRQIEKNS